MNRGMRTFIKRCMLSLHNLGIRCGWFIMPVHYYVSVPNILELKKTKDVWAKKSAMPGIDTSIEEQSSRMLAMCKPYQSEYAGNKVREQGFTEGWGPGYGYIEAQALHGVIRDLKPKRIVEVGAGVSTLCMLQALELNEKEGAATCEYTCIEPYPSEKLRQEKRIKLIDTPVQVVDYSVFESLEAGDFLFIDSSHTVKPGSDVNYLYLEALPRVKPGVVVHIHDITFPYDYDRNTLQEFTHWSESSLLRAFLIFNNRSSILFSMSMLHYDRPESIKEAFPEYERAQDRNGLIDEFVKPYTSGGVGHFPSSIYLTM